MSQPPRNVAASVLGFFRGSDPKYRERSITAIVRMLVVVLCYYALCTALITYWPAWRSGYQSYFRSLGNASFEQFLIWPNASVHFLDLNSPNLIKNIRAAAPPLTLPDAFAVPPRDKEMDTLMLLKNVNPSSPGLGQFRTSSHIIGYSPMALIMSCALATPWPGRRRIWVLFWSLLAIHAFVVFRLAISLLQAGFANPQKTYPLFKMTPWWFEKLKRFDSVINDNPTISYIAPVLIWLMVVAGLEFWTFARQKIAEKIKSSRTSRQNRRGRRDLVPDFRRQKL